MERVIDISGWLENDMWGYFVLPGLEEIVPKVEISPIARVKSEGFYSSKLVLSTLSGTYLEAGSHMSEKNRNLDEYSVEDFIKPVKIVKLPKQKAKALIGARLLESNAPEIEKGDALIIDTGWGDMWNKPGYVLNCPNMDREALGWVVDKDISIFGVDIPCIEGAWADEKEEEKGSLLTAFFDKGTLLLAPLVNLDKLDKNRGKLICLPVHIKGTSGAPARAIIVQ